MVYGFGPPSLFLQGGAAIIAEGLIMRESGMQRDEHLSLNTQIDDHASCPSLYKVLGRKNGDGKERLRDK